MKLEVFGRDVEVLRVDGKWNAYYIDSPGKKRLAHDILIPENLPESKILEFVSDLCHEWATKSHPDAKIVGES